MLPVQMNRWFAHCTCLSRAGSVVSDLDPDAPSRSGRPLHASNARSQERIMARAWQLLRAGGPGGGGWKAGTKRGTQQVHGHDRKRPGILLAWVSRLVGLVAMRVQQAASTLVRELCACGRCLWLGVKGPHSSDTASSISHGPQGGYPRRWTCAATWGSRGVRRRWAAGGSTARCLWGRRRWSMTRGWLRTCWWVVVGCGGWRWVCTWDRPRRRVCMGACVRVWRHAG